MKRFIIILTFIFFYPINSFSDQFNFPNFDINHPNFLCKEKWTKRGVLDENMYNYCMTIQEEGYEEASAIYNEYKSQEWIDEVAKFSLEKWTKKGITDYSMFAYALNTQKEGFLDLMYEIEQKSVTRSSIQKCTNEWYPQYSMIVYCLKN